MIAPRGSNSPVPVLIPHCFHWIWLGPDPLPDHYLAWRRAWLDLHPGWDHVVWTDDCLPDLQNAAEFAQARSYAQKADIARYEIIYQFGGVYLDGGMQCLRNMESRIAGLTAFAGWFDHEIANGVFGATAHHPWLADVIAQLPQAMATGFDILHQTGPTMFTGVIRGRSDVAVLPRDVFYGAAGDEAPVSTYHGRKSWAEQQQQELAERYSRVGALIDQHVPPEQVYMHVEDDIVPYTARRSVSLLRSDGEWLAHPEDDGAALRRVMHAYSSGARYAAFVGPSQWWIGHYAALAAHLSAHRHLVATHELVLVDLGDRLRPPANEE